MQITSLKLENFRSFKTTESIEFSKINILIGVNNSGKSSIIKAIHALQKSSDDLVKDIRLGAIRTQINIEFDSIIQFPAWGLTEPNSGV